MQFSYIVSYSRFVKYHLARALSVRAGAYCKRNSCANHNKRGVSSPRTLPVRDPRITLLHTMELFYRPIVFPVPREYPAGCSELTFIWGEMNNWERIMDP